MSLCLFAISRHVYSLLSQLSLCGHCVLSVLSEPPLSCVRVLFGLHIQLLYSMCYFCVTICYLVVGMQVLYPFYVLIVLYLYSV